MSKKELILQATLELLADQGLQNISVPEIIKTSGVAAGTLYYYFSDKDDLIDRLYLDLKQEAGNALTKGINQDSNFKEQFFLLWKNLYSFYTSYPKKFEFLEDYAHSPKVRNEIKAITQTYYQSAIDLFKSGINIGILRKLPVQLMLNMVFGNISTFARMVLLEEIDPTPELIQHSIQSSWDSVRIN